jgi:hypothetical protein
VRGIIAERGTGLDVVDIIATLSAIDDGLGRGDLVPAFQAEMTRAARRTL